MSINVLLLAGGVGGAKAAQGLALTASEQDCHYNVSVIGNIADDEEFHGLWVSPDIDTLMYTLSGEINTQQGWGMKNDGNTVLSQLQALGEDTWMFLGDRDFATHIYRTQRRRQGIRPSQICRELCAAFDCPLPIILPSDDCIQTRLSTDQGELSFQQYFVRERCAPTVNAIEFHGAQQATPTPEALQAIADADIIIFAPSNPLVSIGAILATPGLRDAIAKSRAVRLAISPFIGGRTVKGPADRMLLAQGLDTSPLSIASLYDGLIDALVIDESDAGWLSAIEQRGLRALATQTLMITDSDKRRLMDECLAFVEQMEVSL